ncbi:sensor histidine kinase [Limibacter armeniacum]|uniref:sensor histidine kinase n=1 Tax=Limibacter armeniacum TaxID=466084 RepID=UPI002FE64BF0
MKLKRKFNYKVLMIPLIWLLLLPIPIGIMLIYGLKTVEEVQFFLINIVPEIFLYFIFQVMVFDFAVRSLNHYLPWNKNLILRFLVDLLVAGSLAAIAINVFPLFFPKVPPPNEIKFPSHDTRIAMPIVMHILIMVIVELINMYEEKVNLEISMEKLKKEQITTKYNVLKQQLDHHFLFNSLSVLSSLIYEDVKRADRFIQELSKIYRYTLNIQEELVVSVQQELQFTDSYVFLISIRFEEGLFFEKNVSDKVLQKYIPPLSLQLLIENAVKHNIVSKEKPIHIRVYEEGDYLVVTNTYQPRLLKDIASNHKGLNNLEKKYALITDKVPSFKVVNKDFVAKIPLIEVDND